MGHLAHSRCPNQLKYINKVKGKFNKIKTYTAMKLKTNLKIITTRIRKLYIMDFTTLSFDIHTRNIPENLKMPLKVNSFTCALYCYFSLLY